uniref:Integrase, catalytic region, zinc finger, CCHC-type, peptidase aspartic, catalytic n=1 Tax=Tanacetum cinerariifolium TaxID=118510 RepID=A0A6L2K8D0_TANCI|nr:integrase, catalytic region, zinc finger, CCHC-type, peptidase aspartic, catalytic [Tanacetum cinerariifolium]
MNVITDVRYVLTQEALDAFCNTFHIPVEVHHILPNQDDTMHERPAGHFRINISQLSVIRASQDMDLFAFIHALDPTKVRVVKKKQDVNEPRLLDTIIGRTVPLLLVAPDRADSELEASVERLFDEGGSGNQTEQGDFARGGPDADIRPFVEAANIVIEDAAPVRLRRQEKRKFVAVDAGDASHPPKKLREDHGIPSKTFVGASVSTTPEREDEGHTDSVAEPNLRTIGARKVAKEKHVKPSLFAVDSSSTGGADPSIDVFSDLTGSDFLMSLSAEVRMRTGYNVKERRRLKSIVEKQDELLKARDGEIENFKAQLLLKEAEATKAICLRAQTSNLEDLEKSLWDEVTDLEASVVGKVRDLTDLNAQLTSVKSQNDSLVDQVCTLHLEKITVYDNCMEQPEKFHDDRMKVVNDKLAKLDSDLAEMACHLKENFYPHLLNTISGRSRAIEKGMQSGLAANIYHGREGMSLADVAAYNPDAEVDFNTALQELREVDFPLLAELKSYKDASSEDITNVLRLEGALVDAPRMNGLQTDIEQLKVPIHRSEDQVALVGVWTPLSEPLSIISLMGEASTSVVVPMASVTTTALSTTFASASFIPPISTDDYEIVDSKSNISQTRPKLESPQAHGGLRTSNALHNAIMEAGGKDRPPMLAPGDYNPPYEYKWTDKDVPVAEGSTETTTKRYMEKYKNVSQDIRDQLNAEAEAVHIILTGIDNDIYSTVDACPNACEMWKAIERLKQGESINVQDLETNLNWEFGKFTSRDGESLESYYLRFYKMTNKLVRNQWNISNCEFNGGSGMICSFDSLNWSFFCCFLCEVTFMRDAFSDYVGTGSCPISVDVSENRGKAVVNSPSPIYDQKPTMVAEDDELSKDKEIDKLMALISLSFKGTVYDNQRIVNVVGARENVGTPVVQKYGIQCYNCKEYGHIARECQKPKRDDTDDEPEDQELEAHYMYMAQIQEVTPDAANNSGPIFDIEPLQKIQNNDNYNVFAIESEHPEQSKFVNDTYPIEQDKHNVIIDSWDMSYDREHVDQDDDDDLANERDLLASLIEKLKCEIDDSKNRNKFLETSNKALVDKLKDETEDFKTKNKSLESSNNHFKEANNELSKTNQLMFKDLKKFQAELDRYHNVKYASKINDLNQTISEIKKELFAHQDTISILSQEKAAQIKFYKTREDKEIDKVIALENKVQVLDNIVYNTGQSVQTMNMLNRNCTMSFAKPEFLKKAQRANPRLYDIGCSNDSLALMLAPESDEVIRLEKERVIPSTSVSRPQLKSNRMEDIVMLNNSQGKKQEVEDHRRNVKFSNNKTFVTACNDSLKAKTSNVNFVCVTCGKCMLNDNHDKCVLHYLNGVNSRTKIPMAMPLSTREPKRIVNQSVATPLRSTVALESTNQKPRHTTRKLYESVSKTCSWWYPKFTPPGYKWKPKSQIGNVKPNLVEIFLFIVDSGCSKHMTGNLKLLTNFVEKFLGSVKFGNDQIAPILGYRDLVQGTVTIKRVYYVQRLNYNLFSVGQFCDADLKVAFWKSACYIRDLKGNDLLTGSRGIDLYSITLQDISSPNPICLIAKATSSQAWLWHRHLSHLNFDTINLLSKNDIVIGLPKLKFVKDHLCSSCELKKAKRKSFQTKSTPSSKRRLQLLYMDLCGPMQVESINGKKYVLVIVDDYSRYTWTHFLRSKDETPEVLIDFLRLVQRGLHAQVRTVRTDKGTEFTKPTEKHLNVVKRIFRYLKDTINMGLWYLKDTGFELTAFLDSDHAGCFDSRKSTSGGIQFLGGDKLVSWSSKKQDCTSMSSVEAEYVSLSACCAQVLWLRTQLTHYGFHFDKIPMYCDSKAAIAISCNPVQHSRTKHIDVRYHFIKEKVEKGIVELFFVETEYQLADLFTKALSEDRFKYLVKRLGMRCLTPEELEVLANESA